MIKLQKVHYKFVVELTDILYDGAYTVIYKAKAVGINENKPIDVAVKSLKGKSYWTQEFLCSTYVPPYYCLYFCRGIS